MEKSLQMYETVQTQDETRKERKDFNEWTKEVT
jgi:hypothetical protein